MRFAASEKSNSSNTRTFVKLSKTTSLTVKPPANPIRSKPTRKDIIESALLISVTPDSSWRTGSHKYVAIGDITRLYIHYSDE